MAKWYFLGNAEKVLHAKRLRRDLDEIAEALDGTNLADATVKRELKAHQWPTSERIWDGAQYTYDGFKDGVALEAIGPSTSNGRAITYGLIRMELGHRRPIPVEAGVLIVSTRKKKGTRRPHFDEAKEFAQRFREAAILRIPVAILGIETGRRG